MSQSLSKLYVHLVFHVKNNEIPILPKDEPNLYAYMASIIRDRQSIPIIINGTENHVHILFVLSKNVALSSLVEDVKKHSSRRIKTLDEHYSQFAWQGGYGAFLVSASAHDKTKKYIENQKEHHKKIAYNEEYLLFLKEYGIDYDDRYLWTD
ncbi:MAG: transposase [Capnocytophaga sp.]|nr:transposase [Capnocytophaga sp.]